MQFRLRLPMVLKYGTVILSLFVCLHLHKINWRNKMQLGDRPPSVEQSDWQDVPGSKNKFAIYSAYSRIDRSPFEVLIIGITKNFTNDSIHCKFHISSKDEERHHPNTTPGTIETLLPGSIDVYAGIFIRCPLPTRVAKDITIKPEMVSVLLNQEEKALNNIRIQYQTEFKEVPFQYNFSVCVKPIFNSSQVLPLLEWLEFYKLMGVQQFTFYNMSIGPEASCILNELKNGKDSSIKINILPWTNHRILNTALLTSRNNVHKSSIAAAQNDCVYRHRGHNSKYMAFVDLDEFIMPRVDVAKNYQELIDFLDAQNRFRGFWGVSKLNFGEYQFKNGFFILTRPDDPQLLRRCSPHLHNSLIYRICRESLLVRKDLRESHFQHYHHRSKYIIRPKGVKQTSTHFVNELENGYLSLKVDEGLAFSRHYRFFLEGNETVRDGMDEELGVKLLENLSNQVEPLMKRCNIKLNLDQ